MFSPMCRASVVVLALLAWNGAASATLISSTIYFSIDSSADPGDPPLATDLDASITYTFDDVAGTLTIDFDNTSSGILTELYFSTSSNETLFDIESVTLTDASIRLNPNNPIDGMGSYMWLIDLGPGGAGIDDLGAGVDGTIVLSWDEDVSNLDFDDFFILTGDNYGPAVLKFQSLDKFGDNYNSAFGLGSPVPEPATLGLLSMGILGIAATRLRRRTA